MWSVGDRNVLMLRMTVRLFMMSLFTGISLAECNCGTIQISPILVLILRLISKLYQIYSIILASGGVCLD